jgi:hypothetical protein
MPPSPRPGAAGRPNVRSKKRSQRWGQILLGLVTAVVVGCAGIGLWLYLNPSCPRDPMGDAQAFLTGNPPAEAIYAKALACRQCQAVDASIQLFRRAADAGNGPAAHELGKIYDPADLAPPGLGKRALQAPEANPVMAANWYERALADGDQTASSDLDALVNWARAAAAKGDDQASELLRQLGR